MNSYRAITKTINSAAAEADRLGLDALVENYLRSIAALYRQPAVGAAS